jgi:hypothetical protein
LLYSNYIISIIAIYIFSFSTFYVIGWKNEYSLNFIMHICGGDKEGEKWDYFYNRKLVSKYNFSYFKVMMMIISGNHE